MHLLLYTLYIQFRLYRLLVREVRCVVTDSAFKRANLGKAIVSIEQGRSSLVNLYRISMEERTFSLGYNIMGGVISSTLTHINDLPIPIQQRGLIFNIVDYL